MFVNTAIIQFNSIQFIIYVPSQQLQGQLQTQHSDFRIIIIFTKDINNNNNNNNNNIIIIIIIIQ
jgi:hypothetical protein